MSQKQVYKDLIAHVENWLFGVPQSMGDAGRHMMTERGRDFSEVY